MNHKRSLTEPLECSEDCPACKQRAAMLQMLSDVPRKTPEIDADTVGSAATADDIVVRMVPDPGGSYVSVADLAMLIPKIEALMKG